MKGFITYAADEKLRYTSSTGGTCKQIIKFCLDNNIVDNAIITLLDKPFSPKTIITNNLDIILSPKCNSIYEKTNPLSVLSQLKINERYIFVGLPCHILPFKTYCEKYSIKNITICLLCNCTPINFLEKLIAKENINKENIKEVYYRGNGWPGYVHFIFNDGTDKKINAREAWSYWYNKHFEVNKKCLLCKDILSYHSDFCVGDAWHLFDPTKKQDGINCTLAVNDNAINIIKNAGDQKYLVYDDLDEMYFKRLEDEFYILKNKRYEKFNM